MSKKLTLTNIASENIVVGNETSTTQIDSQTLDMSDFIMIESNVSRSNSDASLANSSTRTINPDGTRTLNHGNFKSIEASETREVNRNKYINYEIFHENVLGEDGNIKYNKFTVAYGGKIRRDGDPSSNRECHEHANNRRINNPVKIFSKRLCDLVDKVSKNNFKNQVELFNYTLIEIMKFYGVEGKSFALADSEAKKFIKRAKANITKFRAKKALEIASRKATAPSLAPSESSDIPVITINDSETIVDNSNLQPSESSEQITLVSTNEQKTSEEMEEEIKRLEKETRRMKELMSALEDEIKEFEKCKNKLEFLIRKACEKHDLGITMLLNYDYSDKTFPETLESYLNNIRYCTFNKTNKSGSKQEVRTVAYTYDRKHDILCYGASVFRKVPTSLISNTSSTVNRPVNLPKNVEKIIYSEDRGRAVARLRLIRAPVIVNEFSKTVLKKEYEIKETDDKKRYEQYMSLMSSAFNDALLHYVCYNEKKTGTNNKHGEKKYGCSNRKSNGKKDLKILDKVISENPILKEELSFQNIPKSTLNKKMKNPKSLRSNLSNSSIGSSNSVRSNNSRSNSNKNKASENIVTHNVDLSTNQKTITTDEQFKNVTQNSSYNMY